MHQGEILMVIASSLFRDEEYKQPKDVFEQNNYRVTVASTTLNLVKGMISLEVTPDILLENVDESKYDAIVFVGGSGSTEFWNHSIAHSLILDMNRNNKIVAAICLAPVALGRAGILKGKKGTVYSSATEELIKTGAIYSKNEVVVDDNIVTANGPGAAKAFGESILSLLKARKK